MIDEAVSIQLPVILPGALDWEAYRPERSFLGCTADVESQQIARAAPSSSIARVIPPRSS